MIGPLTRLIGVLLMLLALPAELFAQRPDDSKSVLTAMRSRDAIFDNARLYYERSGEHLHRIHWQINGQNGQPYLPPKLMKYCYLEDAAVRGGDITFTQIVDPSRTETDARYGISTIYHKSTNRDGLCRSWSRMPGENRTTDIEFETSEGRSSIIREKWMQVEFGMGFGFGKRLEIKSIEAGKSGWVIEGRMQIWRKDDSSCRLEVDRDYVVRKAAIDTDADGNLWRFEIDTRGSVRQGDFSFAKSGHFKRTWQGTRKGDKIEGKPEVREECHFAFRKVEFHLKYDVYETLTDFNPPRNSYVHNRDTGAQYEIDDQGRIKVNTPARPPK